MFKIIKLIIKIIISILYNFKYNYNTLKIFHYLTSIHNLSILISIIKCLINEVELATLDYWY